jgi:hypothetical protein
VAAPAHDAAAPPVAVAPAGAAADERVSEYIVHIIGAPVACAEGVKETWRDLAGWIGGEIAGAVWHGRFHHLLRPLRPQLPAPAARCQLPLVLVNGDVLTSGGKLSMPVIRRHLDALGVQPQTG